jgi:exonuclease III
MHVVTSKSNAGYAGVAVISRHPIPILEVGTDEPSLDDEARVLIADIGSACIANIYTVNSGEPGNLRFLDKRLQFDTAVRRKLSRFKDKPLLVVGDLNVTARQRDAYHSHPDHPACTQAERDSFRSYLTELGLVDAQAHLGVDGYTFFMHGRGSVY